MNNIKIYFVLIGVMFLWGMNVSAIKLLVSDFMPVTITSIRIFVAAMIVFFILFPLKKVRKPKNREWLYIILGAFLSIFVHHYFISEGLAKTSAANGGLILGLGPMLTAILSIVLLKRKPSIIRLVGFLLGGVGVSFTVLAGSGGIHNASSGDFEVFLAILSQAFSFILIKKASETLDPLLLTGYMLLFGSAMLFVTSLLIEPNGLASLQHGSPFIWLMFIFSAVLATALGNMVYNYVIGQIGAAETSIFLNLSTFFSLIGAALFLKEEILPSHFIGLLLIVPGVILGSGSLEELLIRRKEKLTQHPQKKISL
ncbi:DMT family transporter [Metabacillus sediminilitoris]|uniref:DMT family transporter n=1 Tax=Metabacillus sediminilitoris TaxID=2567941 RepID=A0A4S4BVN5_9BACI|nr:DMT family transporter [Metabacillus sediminilitoris]QGQ46170.1 EamA family transporter [Metabacillus sediminilitoris]THF79223.1 DMT family transporter [Metabacillus sediminilitoris]